MTLKSAKDLYSGLLFVAIGSVFAAGAHKHAMGSGARMGPGYFPRMLGVALALAGLVCIARALWGRHGEDQAIGPIAWRPVLVVLGSLGAFALALPVLGFFLSVALLVVLGSFAARDMKPAEIIIVALVLATSCWLVFVKGLALPFPSSALFG
jgi:hypothetical protein